MDQEINQQRIKNIGQMLMEMAAGNFAYRIPRTDYDDELEGLTLLVNWVAEEMRESIFHGGYLNPHYSYRYVIQSSYILDSNFTIKDVSADVPSLLGFDCDELLGKDFTEILTKKSALIWKAIKDEIVQHETYQITVLLEFFTFYKLLIPVYCSISSLWQKTEIIISSFSVVIDEVKGKESLLKELFSAEEQKIHNYLDVKSTQAVYDYVLANMDSTLPTLKELSKIFGTNEYKLKNGFRQLFKITIQQFYNNERLKRSQLLIKETKIPLKTIAVMAGFSTYPNFSRAFKIKFGYSPTKMERR
ncbi:helix-turn-helix domain-containing protein [Flavobacterium sp. LS2P90]|uniref:Helix-turn-helix domain-containing protein n=1 Tax=Flavobacterium xylosi TaxID=3230415 RepID=A0ABW6HSM3_9FLAO